jgi:hypothetical protein
MVVRAADAGWRVAEHDVPYLARTGVSKVTGTWRGTWQAVRDMRRVLAEPPPPARAHDLVPPSGGARISARPEARTAARPGVPAGAQVTAPPSAPAPAPSRGGTVQ